MNIKRVFPMVFAAAVLMAPSALVAQTDNGGNPSLGPLGPTGASYPQPPQPGQSGSQPGAMSNGTQSNTPNSMRDSLGAPGQVGQEILDKQFVRSAVEVGLGDVKLGTLAEQKGGSDVKDLAQKLVDDHTAMNKEMDAMADTLGVMLPKKANKEDQAEYEKLSGLSGKDFDTEYLTYIIKAHWATLHSFYMEASASQDTDLQSLVVKDLGTMHQHLGMIAKTATAEGITLPPRPPRPGRPAATTAAK